MHDSRLLAVNYGFVNVCTLYLCMMDWNVFYLCKYFDGTYWLFCNEPENDWYGWWADGPAMQIPKDIALMVCNNIECDKVYKVRLSLVS